MESPCFFSCIFGQNPLMKFTYPKRIYFSTMIALTVLCMIQAVRYWFKQEVRRNRIFYMSGWILMSLCSGSVFFYAYMKAFQKRESPRFGEVYHLTQLQVILLSCGKKIFSSSGLEKLSTAKKQLPDLWLFVCCCGNCLAFLITLWRVWQSPQPWPQYKMVVIYLAIGLGLMRLRELGLRWIKFGLVRWGICFLSYK